MNEMILNFKKGRAEKERKVRSEAKVIVGKH